MQRCSCCGRRKKHGEVFETVSEKIKICVDCGQLLYRIREAENEGNQELKSEQLTKLRRRLGNNSEEFLAWFNSEYLKKKA